MAEPVGIVGTAVGIVSFGLQLYSAVATYIDALDGRKDDVAAARAQLDGLRDSLISIESALTTTSSGSTGTSRVPSIVTECKTELDQLEGLLQNLVGSRISSNKLKERIRSLKFPFRRDSLMKLEDRLHKTNSVFQTALSVLNLNKSLDNESRLANVEAATADVPSVNTNVVQLSTDVQELGMNIEQVSRNVAVLSRVDSTVTQLAATAGQSLLQISNRVASIERQIRGFSALGDGLQMLSLLEQALGIQDAQGQVNLRFALQRLLSKPSQTREVYDNVSQLMSIINHRGSSFDDAYGWPINNVVRTRSCSCLCQNNRRGSIRGLKTLWLRIETIYHEHSQDCELSKLKFEKSRRRLELVATRPFSFLPWSLGISLALTTGAGGFSISPNITLRPIIDEERSSIFRILRAFQWFLESGSYTDAEFSCGVSVTKNTILGLYWKKKAFVNEINEWGTSAISRMIEILVHTCVLSPHIRNRQAVAEALSDMVVELVSAGLPANDCNSWGATPVSRLALSEIANYTKGLLPVLYKEVPDRIRGDGLFYFRLRDLRFYRGPSDSSLRYVFEHIRTEMFECGPLSTAIAAQRDEREINALILAKNVSEVNLLGQTPLHLAAGTGNTNVLTALLRTEGIQGTFEARDASRYHVIDYAAFYSGMTCCNGRTPVPCSGCKCTSALNVLLCAKGCFDGYLHTNGLWDFHDIVHSASHSSRLRIFTEIKLRRGELKQLAISCLNNGDIQRFKLDSDGVLDHHGIEVVECLDDMGIEVSVRLRDAIFGPDEGPSIFHMLLQTSEPDEHTAQMLFDLGFSDIDEPDELGITPLMILGTSLHSEVAPLMLWFAEHGADLTRTVPSIGLQYGHSCSKVAHLLSHKWGKAVPLDTWKDADFISKIAPVIALDECKCYCTGDGCTPASILFFYISMQCTWKREEGEGRSSRFWESRHKIIIHTGLVLATIFKYHDVNLANRRHMSLVALRMLTFEALGIRHTCGCRDSDDVSLTDEDVEDMWDEDAHLIGRLHELHAEFETSFDNSKMSFIVFITKKWVPRIESVLQELEKVEMSEAERKDAETLGVKWDSCEARKHIQDYNLLYPKSLRDYLRAIRKIAQE